MQRTVCAVLIMAASAVGGLFLGAMLNDPVGGMILLALISGVACIIAAIESRER